METEATFDVPRRWTFPRLAGAAGLETVTQVAPAARFTQTATYLDTPDLALLGARHTLRRRTGGTDAGWHLKKPRGGDSRLEVHEPLGRSSAFVPPALRAEVADIVRADPLVPIAVLRTRRAERRILVEGDRVLALVADDSVEATVHLGGEQIHRWREVEVELVDATPEEFDSLLGAFAASGLTRAASQSKLGRAMKDVLSVTPATPEDLRRADVTAGAAAMRYLATQIGVLQATEPAVRADAADAVHKARVATRRLRSVLHTYRILFDTTVTNPLRSEIKWLTSAYGGPRDAEVMRERLLGMLDGLEEDLVVGPVARRLRDTLTSDHELAHLRLVAALDSRRYERLMADLQELIVFPPTTEAAAARAADALPSVVKKAAKAVVSAATTAEHAEAAGDLIARDVAIHEIRKKGKAARYAAEAAGPAISKRQAGSVDAWTSLQEALGDYQDGIVARDVLSRLCSAARAASEDTFTYGVLTEREAAGGRAVLARYDALLTDALRASGHGPTKGKKR